MQFRDRCYCETKLMEVPGRICENCGQEHVVDKKDGTHCIIPGHYHCPGSKDAGCTKCRR